MLKSVKPHWSRGWRLDLTVAMVFSGVGLPFMSYFIVLVAVGQTKGRCSEVAGLSLTHLKGNTYLIPSPTNIGLYVEGTDVVIIDSGNSKEAGRRILRVIEENGWHLRMIVNTHSNADHIGGNDFLQKRTGCRIAASSLESPFIHHPILEPSLLNGGFPFSELRNHFLMASPSCVTDCIQASGVVPGTRLKAIPLPGHFLGMVGIVSPDDVFFTADSVFPKSVLAKYHMVFVYDVKAQLETLARLQDMTHALYVPCHGQPTSDITELVYANRKKISEIAERIYSICREARAAEDILREICSVYRIELNLNQYVLLLSTIRAYLGYLLGEGRLEYLFWQGRMLWRAKAPSGGAPSNA